MLVKWRFNGSAIETGVDFLAPCGIIIGCNVVAGNIIVCGIEVLVHEMVELMRYTGIHTLNS